jgi:hypothetical protein
VCRSFKLRLEPVPAWTVQATRVLDVKTVVKHALIPSSTDGVESARPKFIPSRVSESNPEEPKFGTVAYVISAESNVNHSSRTA